MGNSSTVWRLCISIRDNRNKKSISAAPTDKEDSTTRLPAKFKSVYNYIKSKSSFSSYPSAFGIGPCCRRNSRAHVNDSLSSSSESEVLDMDFRNTRDIMNDYKNGFFDKNLSNMIEKILPTVRSVIMKNNQENPSDVAMLQQIAKNESLWERLLFTLIDKIEMDDQLGPSIIAIFVEETLLPTKDQIQSLTTRLTANQSTLSEKSQRNMLVVLSCLSEKIAGTSLASTLNENTVDFTLDCLTLPEPSHDCSKNEYSQDKLSVVLFALVALEKFSMSSQSKHSIMSKLSQAQNPLVVLAEWRSEKNTVKHQIGFLAEYLLDNIFTPDNHVYSYLKLNSLDSVNVRLNDHDTSENLKISPDGFEARNDTLTFESVRSTLQVDEGVWFYEVTLLTNGIMQIGFATKSASFLNDQGFGIGDDCYSVGYDGCRNLIWYNAGYQEIKYQSAWQAGDVIGFLLDMEHKKISFYHNGNLVTPFHTDIFQKVSNGIFPAASFMSFQHVVFNFGREPYKYPPKLSNVSNFNSFGVLADDSKFVLPKRKKLEILRLVKVKDDACSICCENIANTVLIPCKHDGFCETCIRRLVNCPICRTDFVEYELF